MPESTAGKRSETRSQRMLALQFCAYKISENTALFGMLGGYFESIMTTKNLDFADTDCLSVAYQLVHERRPFSIRITDSKKAAQIRYYIETLENQRITGKIMPFWDTLKVYLRNGKLHRVYFSAIKNGFQFNLSSNDSELCVLFTISEP